jgi:predicted metal-dependent hydrolase
MHFALSLSDGEVPVAIRTVARVRAIRVSVDREGAVRISKPRWVAKRDAFAFAAKHVPWIEGERRARVATRRAYPHLALSYDTTTRRAARARAEALVADVNRTYGFRVGSVSIRNQSTRWGSCSQEGNLSFNYRIVSLSPELATYLVAHELCHIAEPNHGPRFWELVGRAVPEYRNLRRALRRLPL